MEDDKVYVLSLYLLGDGNQEKNLLRVKLKHSYLQHGFNEVHIAELTKGKGCLRITCQEAKPQNFLKRNVRDSKTKKGYNEQNPGNYTRKNVAPSCFQNTQRQEIIPIEIEDDTDPFQMYSQRQQENTKKRSFREVNDGRQYLPPISDLAPFREVQSGGEFSKKMKENGNNWIDYSSSAVEMKKWW